MSLHYCDTFSNIEIKVEVFQDFNTLATRIFETNALKLDAPPTSWVQSGANPWINYGGSVDEFKDPSPCADSTHD